MLAMNTQARLQWVCNHSDIGMESVTDLHVCSHRCDFICALFQILRQCTNWRIRIRIEIHMWKLGIKNMKSPKFICHVDVEIGIILNWRLSCSYRLQSRLPTKNQHEKKKCVWGSVAGIEKYYNFWLSWADFSCHHFSPW